jgi:hypothetical protein
LKDQSNLPFVIGCKEPKILAHFRRFCNGQKASEEVQLPEVINIEAASFDHALEGSPWDRFVPVHCDDHPSVGFVEPGISPAQLQNAPIYRGAAPNCATSVHGIGAAFFHVDASTFAGAARFGVRQLAAALLPASLLAANCFPG